MVDLNGTRVAILAVDGFEQIEMFEPLERLEAAGAEVEIVSLSDGTIMGWDSADWGDDIEVNRIIEDVEPSDFDLIFIPGGRISPDVLRADAGAVELLKQAHADGVLIAAICHAPCLLTEAGLAKKLKLTSFPSIRTDLINAGAEWVDEPAVFDNNIITGQGPDELTEFIEVMMRELDRLPGKDDEENGDGVVHHL